MKHFVRHETVDCALAGRDIKTGDRLYLGYPSGNRDDAEFDDTYTFRLDRKRNRHVGFGQHVPRAEMRVLWEAVLQELKSVEMAGDTKLIASEFVSGPKSVPICFTLN